MHRITVVSYSHSIKIRTGGTKHFSTDWIDMNQVPGKWNSWDDNNARLPPCPILLEKRCMQ